MWGGVCYNERSRPLHRLGKRRRFMQINPLEQILIILVLMLIFFVRL